MGKVEKVSECDIQFRGGSKVFVSCYSERKRTELKAKIKAKRKKVRKRKRKELKAKREESLEGGREGGEDAEEETCHRHRVDIGRPQVE